MPARSYQGPQRAAPLAPDAHGRKGDAVAGFVDPQPIRRPRRVVAVQPRVAEPRHGVASTKAVRARSASQVGDGTQARASSWQGTMTTTRAVVCVAM